MEQDVYVLSDQDFEFAQLNSHIEDQKFEGKAIGYFQDGFIRFVKNKSSLMAFWIIAFIVAMAIFGPFMNAYSYREQNVDLSYMPPRIPVLEKMGVFDGLAVKHVKKSSIESKYKDVLIEIKSEYKVRKTEMAEIVIDMYAFKGVKDTYYWLGTDSLGRDQWTRLWRGVRISLIISLLAVCTNVFIGVVFGAISGYFGGTVDMLMQRFAEILNGIPQIVIVVLFVFYVGPGIVPIALAFVVKGWIGMSRMIRAQFFRYKGMEYVLASRTMGATHAKLIFRHILPNAIGPIITMATLAIPAAIFGEAFLAYIGLGLQAPEPSIGILLSEGQKVLLDYPYLTIFPALLISMLMISFNLFGNGLRDAFDPTLRGVE